jgi:hypothetical protein
MVKLVSKVFYTDSPRYSGEHWRVVVLNGTSSVNHGFTSEEAAQAFHDEQKETAVNR